MICPDDYYVQFSHPFVNRNDNLLFALVRQFFFVPDQTNKFVDLRMLCFLSCLNQFCWNLINIWRLIFFELAYININFRGTRPEDPKLWRAPLGGLFALWGGVQLFV
jgi:hypothetical protein